MGVVELFLEFVRKMIWRGVKVERKMREQTDV